MEEHSSHDRKEEEEEDNERMPDLIDSDTPRILPKWMGVAHYFAPKNAEVAQRLAKRAQDIAKIMKLDEPSEKKQKTIFKREPAKTAAITTNNNAANLQSEREPTEEQHRIVKCRGQTVCIQAYAGTGKTTTLRMFCKEYLAPSGREQQGKMIVYLVFNKEMQKSAERLFKRDGMEERVTCLTIDSLCNTVAQLHWASVGKGTRKGIRPLNHVLVREMCPAVAGSPLAYAVVDTLKRFAESPGRNIQVTREDIDPESYYVHEANKILDAANDLWDSVYSGEAGWSCHEFNRKIAVVSTKVDDHMAQCFHTMLIDECQDLSPIAMDIIQRFQGARVFVGDMHQSIYASFMHTVNAFRLVKPTHKFHLSRSFRFGARLAQHANWILSYLKRVQTSVWIEGNDEVDTKLQPIGESVVPRTEIARTNKSLFESAVQHADLKLYWDGGKEFLDKVRNTIPKLANEKAWATSFKVAQRHNDQETIMLMTLVEKYRNNLTALNDLMAGVRKRLVQADRAELVLSTVHKAKGSEWDHVIVLADIGEAILRCSLKNPEQLEEEINIYYVAVTRAILVLDDRAHRHVKDLHKKTAQHKTAKANPVRLEEDGDSDR